MPNSSPRKKQDIKNKYGGGYAIFSKDNKARQRRRNVTPKKDRSKIITITKKEISRPTVTSLDNLISKLDYSYDSLATINVIFDSLYFTYTNSKDDIEQHKNQTRLGEMEKELLAAYDDLYLQINHLEKDLNKMEGAFDELKAAHIMSDDEGLSSPSFSSSSISSPSSIFLESDCNILNFSTDLLSPATNNKQFEEQLNNKNAVFSPYQNYF